MVSQKRKSPIKNEAISLIDCYKALSELKETQVKNLQVQFLLLYELYIAKGNPPINGLMELINYEPKLDSKYC